MGDYALSRYAMPSDVWVDNHYCYKCPTCYRITPVARICSIGECNGYLNPRELEFATDDNGNKYVWTASGNEFHIGLEKKKKVVVVDKEVEKEVDTNVNKAVNKDADKVPDKQLVRDDYCICPSCKKTVRHITTCSNCQTYLSQWRTWRVKNINGRKVLKADIEDAKSCIIM
jgi:hypothetical protein